VQGQRAGVVGIGVLQRCLFLIPVGELENYKTNKDRAANIAVSKTPRQVSASSPKTHRTHDMKTTVCLLLILPLLPPSFPSVRLPRILSRSFSLLLFPTATFSTVIGKRKVTAEEPLVSAESNCYQKGPHREEDSARGGKRHIDKAKKDQNTALDRYVL